MKLNLVALFPFTHDEAHDFSQAILQALFSATSPIGDMEEAEFESLLERLAGTLFGKSGEVSVEDMLLLIRVMDFYLDDDTRRGYLFASAVRKEVYQAVKRRLQDFLCHAARFGGGVSTS